MENTITPAPVLIHIPRHILAGLTGALGGAIPTSRDEGREVIGLVIATQLTKPEVEPWHDAVAVALACGGRCVVTDADGRPLLIVTSEGF